MSVYGYVRVSTDKQELETQKTTINSYSVVKGYNLNNVFSHVVSSRKGSTERGIEDLLNQTKRGDVLLVSELSRLSRSMSETLPLIEKISRKGVELHVIKQNLVIRDIEEDFSSKILVNVLGIVNEMERKMISERTKMGLERVKKQGVKLGNPKLHQINRERKEQSSEFSEKVRGIIQPMLDSGLTQREIVDRLNESGVETSRGGRWYLQTLQRVVNRF